MLGRIWVLSASYVLLESLMRAPVLFKHFTMFDVLSRAEKYGIELTSNTCIQFILIMIYARHVDLLLLILRIRFFEKFLVGGQSGPDRFDLRCSSVFS